MFPIPSLEGIAEVRTEISPLTWPEWYVALFLASFDAQGQLQYDAVLVCSAFVTKRSVDKRHLTILALI